MTVPGELKQRRDLITGKSQRNQGIPGTCPEYVWAKYNGLTPLYRQSVDLRTSFTGEQRITAQIPCSIERFL